MERGDERSGRGAVRAGERSERDAGAETAGGERRAGQQRRRGRGLVASSSGKSRSWSGNQESTPAPIFFRRRSEIAQAVKASPLPSLHGRLVPTRVDSGRRRWPAECAFSLLLRPGHGAFAIVASPVAQFFRRGLLHVFQPSWRQMSPERRFNRCCRLHCFSCMLSLWRRIRLDPVIRLCVSAFGAGGAFIGTVPPNGWLRKATAGAQPSPASHLEPRAEPHRRNRLFISLVWVSLHCGALLELPALTTTLNGYKTSCATL